MSEPERSPRGHGGQPSPGRTRGGRVRAAALRPINLLMLVVGAGAFAGTLEWWIPPLTLATYAALVALAAREPPRRIRGTAPAPGGGVGSENAAVSPERRARWLPRGETRQRTEAALDVYRKVVAAVEQSDDVTRAVLEDAVPKLHAAADRLVDVARRREEAAEEVRNLRRPTGSPTPGEERAAYLGELEEELRAADAEISGMVERFLALRARAVRASIVSGSPDQTTAVERLNASLDELNLRLDALNATMSPPEDRRPERKEDGTPRTER